MAFKERLLYGLQKIKSIITEMISSHNSSATAHNNHFTDSNAHAPNINGRISAHNLDITAHPNGFTEWIKITSTNTANSPTTDNTHKNMGDVTFCASDGTQLGHVGADLLRDKDGKVFRVIYLQALSNTSDQSAHTSIAIKNTLDGATKVIHSDATLQTVATDRCTATTPTNGSHIANKTYVDGKITTVSQQLAGKSDVNHTHTAAELGIRVFPTWTNVTNVSANTTYTAQYDGYLMLGIGGGNGTYWIDTTINGTTYRWNGNTDNAEKYGWQNMQLCLPMAKGTTYYFTGSKGFKYARFVAAV